MRRPVFFSLSALLFAALFLAPSGAPSRGDAESGKKTTKRVRFLKDEVRASRNGDRVTMHFPVRNSHPTREQVSYRVAVFSLQGKRVAGKSGSIKVSPGKRVINVPLGALPFAETSDSEVEYVVSYKLESENRLARGKHSLFALLPRVAISARLPEKLFADHPTRVPVVLTDSRTGRPYRSQEVLVEVTDGGGKSRTVRATTDEHGTALLALPGQSPGRIKVAARGAAGGSGEAVVSTSLEVVEQTRIHLSLDKPLYQPGQTMHIRALVLARPDMEPLTNEDLLVEVADAKGNKVFKEVARTNGFGVASARFTLANQVNKGKYKITVTAGDNQMEKAVTVDRYVLPKFKVDVALDRAFYQPSQALSGTVSSQYFFGKPTSDAKVKVTLFDYQATWVPHRVIEGTTNESGIFSFEAKLPGRLVGQPVEGGNALMLLEAKVTDSAGQSRQVAKQVTVASDAVQVQMFPESGAVVPGVENHFFLAVSDPGGSPLPGDCEVSFRSGSGDSRRVSVGVDSSGLARVAYTPRSGSTDVTAEVAVKTDAGDAASRSFSFVTNQQDARVLVRTEASILRVGGQLVVEVAAAGAMSDAFLDITRDNQTMAVATVVLDERGWGRHVLDLDPTLAGTLAVSAYVLSSRGEYTRDTRVVFVRSANELQVTVDLDRETYLPGGEATVSFAVRDAQGPVQSALGIQVVDEAVFALSESRPGLLRLFFALEEELLKPSYQIGRGVGATLGALLQQEGDGTEPVPRRTQEEAAAAIAAQGDVAVARQVLSSAAAEREAVRGRLDVHGAWLRGQMLAALQGTGSCDWNGGQLNQKAAKAMAQFRRDAWGRSYRTSVSEETATLRSAGPDRRFDTWDDVEVSVTGWELCPPPKKVRRGGWGGGPGGNLVPMAAMADAAAVEKMDAPADKPMEEAREERETTTAGTKSPKSGTGKKVRVRKWFPETLFVENCLVTDEDGRASVHIPLADSITTWRLSTVASDRAGHIGGKDAPLRVFQDFFIDIDFPVFLTRLDEVTFPVVVYNYLEQEQEVRLEVEKGEWYELTGPATATLTLAPGQVASVSFPVRITRVGWHALTVFGRGSGGFSDAVQRKVEVRPDGQEVQAVFGGSLKGGKKGGDHQETVPLRFPGKTIAESQSVVVQILPGLTSHVVQGMESMLKLPGGCFEQTTSSAWPNVLALKYLRDTEQATPEIEMKAMQYVNVGYQRILTFECGSGGFNWWQNDPVGNVVLSALAIMQLTDASKVYKAVDRKVIERSYDFLSQQQKGDGSWAQDTHLHAGNENLGQGSLRTTCYIAWALQEGGFGKSRTAQRAFAYVEGNLPENKDLYTQGMCANALALAGREGPVLDKALAAIDAAAVQGDDELHWEPGAEKTLMHSGGKAAMVEVTSLMALAYIHANHRRQDVPAIVNWLAGTKDPQGNWGYNTQATVLALKTFLKAATLDGGDTHARVAVLLDGRKLGEKSFDNFNKEVVWQLEVPARALEKGEHELTLDYSGKGNLGYQVVARHFVPWSGGESAPEPLNISVDYDRTRIKVDDHVKVTATFTRQAEKAVGPVLATLGVPPGFDVRTEDLDDWKREKVIRSYELTGRQLILYLDTLPLNQPVAVSYRLRARVPVKAQAGESEVRLYYEADVRGTSGPRKVESH